MSAAIQAICLPRYRNILNHDIMSHTADEGMGYYLYSGRALGLSEPWDIIQLHPHLRPYWFDIRAHYERIGLRHSINVIWDVSLRELGKHIGHQPSVYYFASHECRFWGDQAWLNSANYISSRNNFISLARQQGVDIPDTRCYQNKRLIEDNDIASFPYPCYLKSSLSSTTAHLTLCRNEEDVTDAVAAFRNNTSLQVQKALSAEAIVNLQYQVINDEIHRISACEKIQDQQEHRNYRSPALLEPWDTVEPIARWLRNHGMKGVFSFDVAIVQTEQGLRFQAIEATPHFNDASYPALIAQRLDIPEWRTITLETRHAKIADIDLSDIEYEAYTGEGVIIVNWGTIKVGKLTFLLAGSREYQEAVLEELKVRL